jgi:hypothetical protein
MIYSIPNIHIEAQHSSGCGPCTTRPMTKEERQKYGPPVKKTRQTIAKLWEARRQARVNLWKETMLERFGVMS